MVYAQRKLKLSLQPRSLLLYILQGIVLALLFDFGIDKIQNNWLSIALAVLISLAVLTVTGLSRLKSLLKINQTQP